MRNLIFLPLVSLLLPAQISATQIVSQPQPKVVYLTFDADMTHRMQAIARSNLAVWYDQNLFDYLVQNKISATIFSTGLFAETYPDVIKNLAKNNFIEFGNHSYDHAGFEKPCYKLPTVSTDPQKIHEITAAQNSIKQVSGQTPKFFRFPGLCQNVHDEELVKEQGLTVSDGNVLSGDAFNKNTPAIVNNIMRQVKDGSVVLMHVGGPNAPKDNEVLRIIVPKLREMGYSFGIL